MAKQLQKLELTWIGKGNEPKLEPRVLIEEPSKSFGLQFFAQSKKIFEQVPRKQSFIN